MVKRNKSNRATAFNTLAFKKFHREYDKQKKHTGCVHYLDAK
jgi:hypothetical protein